MMLSDVTDIIYCNVIIVFGLKHLIMFGAPPLSYRFLESASKATCKAAESGSARLSTWNPKTCKWLWMTLDDFGAV